MSQQTQVTWATFSVEPPKKLFWCWCNVHLHMWMCSSDNTVIMLRHGPHGQPKKQLSTAIAVIANVAAHSQQLWHKSSFQRSMSWMATAWTGMVGEPITLMASKPTEVGAVVTLTAIFCVPCSGVLWSWCVRLSVLGTIQLNVKLEEVWKQACLHCRLQQIPAGSLHLVRTPVKSLQLWMSLQDEAQICEALSQAPVF